MENEENKELETLIHRLRKWAAETPQKAFSCCWNDVLIALRYFDGKGKVIASRTYDVTYLLLGLSIGT